MPPYLCLQYLNFNLSRFYNQVGFQWKQKKYIFNFFCMHVINCLWMMYFILRSWRVHFKSTLSMNLWPRTSQSRTSWWTGGSWTKGLLEPPESKRRMKMHTDMEEKLLSPRWKWICLSKVFLWLIFLYSLGVGRFQAYRRSVDAKIVKNKISRCRYLGDWGNQQVLSKNKSFANSRIGKVSADSFTMDRLMFQSFLWRS